MSARSSLAARRTPVSPAGQPSGDASWGDKTVAWGAEGLAVSPSPVSPRVSGARSLRAPWMAEIASSVASFDLLGNFAMSVVAPSLRRTCRRCPNRHDKSAVMPEGRHRYGCCAESSPIYRLMIILSPWQCKRNYAGKDFFIIVNRLVTIANAVPPRRECAMMAAQLRPIIRATDWPA